MTIPHEYIDKDELLFEMTNAFIPQDMDTCRAHSLAKNLLRMHLRPMSHQ